MQIYLITNKINNKHYIGKTIGTLKHRWNDHVSNAKRRPTTSLRRAINKYGADQFTIETLSTHDTLESLNNAEIGAIKKWKSTDPTLGYNLTPGGDGAPVGNTYMKGHHHSETSRGKIAQGHTGLKYGPMKPAQKNKISKALTGIIRGPMPEKRKKELSNSIKESWQTRERKLSKELCEKFSRVRIELIRSKNPVDENKSNTQTRSLCDFIKAHQHLPDAHSKDSEEKSLSRLLIGKRRAKIGKGAYTFFQSDQSIAESFGYPFLFKAGTYEIKSNAMCLKLCEWMKHNKRKPTERISNSKEEKQLVEWLRFKRKAFKRKHGNFYLSDQAIAESYGYPTLFK
jgi:group I intron endonuclease